MRIIDSIINYIKNNLIQLIVVIAIFLISIITTVLYFNIPRLSYKYIEDYDGYVVDHAFGNSKEYTIPATYKEKNVVGFGTRAFYNHTKLERVIAEDNSNFSVVMKLAFSGCKSLKEIDLSNIAIIERNAFSYCSSLAEVEIYATKLGASAFYGCSSLESVILAEGLTSIGSMAFAKTKISDIIIPASVDYIYEGSFDYNDNLKRVIIKNSTLLNDEYIKSLGDIIVYEG